MLTVKLEHQTSPPAGENELRDASRELRENANPCNSPPATRDSISRDSLGAEAPPAEAPTLKLADLCFLTCAGRTELGETWNVRMPDGTEHLCQFLPPTDPETTAALLTRLRSFRHDNLAPWTAAHGDGHRLAILCLLDGPTLWDRFQEMWAGKQSGLAREELLGYLRSAASALDFLEARHRVQHLWLHPRQFIIQEDRAHLFGFGLVHTWWARTQRPAGDLNPRYAAPELDRHVRGSQSDQYSLALIFAEMMTGVHPWRGRSAAGAVRDTDLTLLSKSERAVILRALSQDPRRRFESATALVEALESATKVVVALTPLRPLQRSEIRDQRSEVRDQKSDLRPPTSDLCLLTSTKRFPCHNLNQFVKELVTMVAGQAKLSNELKIHFSLQSGRHLESTKFLGAADNKLPEFRDFCRQWHAKTIHRGDGLVILAINAAPSVWQWLCGRRLGLQIRIEFLPIAWGNKKAEVAVEVRSFGCDQDRAKQLLMELGPKLLESVRANLHGQPEQRGQERLAIRQRLRVSPVVNGAQADAIECVTKDISAGGIGFFFPVELPAYQVYVNLPELKNMALHAALAQVVRKQPTSDGWIEVGAAFPIP